MVQLPATQVQGPEFESLYKRNGKERKKRKKEKRRKEEKERKRKEEKERQKKQASKKVQEVVGVRWRRVCLTLRLQSLVEF